MSRRLALEALKVTEGNITSCWAAAGREVYEPYKEWLELVREAIDALENTKAPRRRHLTGGRTLGEKLVQLAERQRKRSLTGI